MGRVMLLNVETCETDDGYLALFENGKPFGVTYCPVCGVDILARWRREVPEQVERLPPFSEAEKAEELKNGDD